MTINLSYPDNVEGDDQQGHYIMFTINETSSAKVSTRAHGGGPAGMGSGTSTTTKDTDKTGFKGKKFIDSNLNAGAGQSTMSSAPPHGGLWLKRPSTTRMAKAITLYMPPSVKVGYKSNYKDDEISAITKG